ncbi:MAG: HYR domain-containing protein [Planctomycetes bacterium]|nr:HYR domain-containing protein [Planctomycetota bacterium]
MEPGRAVYVAEYYRLRRIDLVTGIITSVAGTGWPTGYIDGEGGNPLDDLGDGGPASAASAYEITDVAIDPTGNLYFSEGTGRRIRRIDRTTGIISTIAGGLTSPRGVATDGASLFIADHVALRRVDLSTGVIDTVVAGSALDVELDAHGDPIFCGSGGIWRRSMTTNATHKLAGGAPLDPRMPDGVPAQAANVHAALGLAIDLEGDVLYAEQLARKVRELDLPRVEILLLSSVAQPADPGVFQATVNLLLEIEGAPSNGAVLRVRDTTGARVLHEAPAALGQVGVGPVLFPLGASVVEAEVLEGGQRVARLSFVVQIQDSMPPTLLGCANKVLEVEGLQTVFTAQKLGISAIDDFDPLPTITFSPSSRSLGNWNITATVRDASGNSRNCSFLVSIVDTTPPMFTQQPEEDIVLELTPGELSTRVTWVVQASDNSGFAPSVICRNEIGQAVFSNSTLFPEGSHLITCTATDSRGNHAETSFRILVRRVTAPVIICPSDISVGTDAGMSTAAVAFTVTATSQIDPNVALECFANGALVGSGSTFPLGMSVVTCYARDIYNNQTSCSFNVLVEDREPPHLQVPSGVVQLVTDCAGREIALNAALLGANASDNADATLDIECSPSSLSPGSHVVGLTVADDAGNRATTGVQVLVLRGPLACQLLRPLDANVDNKIRPGQTVPIKVVVGCEGGFDPSLSVRIAAIYQLGSGGTPIDNAVVEDSGLSNDAGALLRLDVDKYIYNLSTAHWPTQSGARFEVELSIEKPGHVPTPLRFYLRNR